ncbi:hypothetical protein HCN44_001861 [Aphidius gifuensis]|uniref:Cationic amino acid transporter C-terminal domain-containing protein n=1 Tax=Aphidius gifuensis TaxID=684658 RepID=A0A835CUJ9_APHGI|nr:high affinity cationic amino acid transporter 1-like [Aphidius gifuensis]KAF7996229.1 hypothetical protein HCN44_001861 [Aphidius gifuensis]
MASSSWWRALVRRRVEDKDDRQTEMARVMGVLDLTMLGVGATLGLGVYTLAGQIAKEYAGPAVCISFLIAAIASGLSAICYAEFASRVPKSGSAYAYSYVTVGEFIAFVIGWNLIFEYIIGTAAVARSFSQYVDTLFGHKMSDYLRSIFALNLNDLTKSLTGTETNYFGDYVDFFAFMVVMVLTIFLSIGIKESSTLNRVCGTANVGTILIIIIVGFIQADTENWQLPANSTSSHFNETIIIKNETANNTNKIKTDNGGFMPFGIDGIVQGAAHAFFGLVGFDSIASCGEEAINPKKNIPISIVLAIIIATIAYLLVSIVLTLMVPYYNVDAKTAFPSAFEKVGVKVIGKIVNVGGICALITSLIGAMFPLPRILYSMASDGLLFKRFSIINKKTQTPLFATIVSGTLIGFMTLIFDVEQLADLASTGTLLAYSIVAMSVLFLRYQKNDDTNDDKRSDDTITSTESSISNDEICLSNYLGQVFNTKNIKEPTFISGQIACIAIDLFTFFSITFGIISLMIFSNDKSFLNDHKIIGYSLLIFIGVLMLLCIVSMSRQPVAKVDINFKVPLAPFLPCLSIFVNALLMANLESTTWLRFMAWLCVGLGIYFFYGIKNSVQGQRDKRMQLEAEPEKFNPKSCD